MNAMAELLSELSDRVIALEELVDDLNDYVESIDDDLAELEGDGDDDFHTLNDDEYEDAYLDGLDDVEDRLHLLGGKRKGDADDDAETETLAGAICPECGRMFFVGADDAEGSAYVCPHCKEKVVPAPLTPENAPIARPESDE